MEYMLVKPVLEVNNKVYSFSWLKGDAKNTDLTDILDVIDIITIIYFTIEYFLRYALLAFNLVFAFGTAKSFFLLN